MGDAKEEVGPLAESWTVGTELKHDGLVTRIVIDRGVAGARCTPYVGIEAFAIQSAIAEGARSLPKWARLMAAAPAMARALLLAEVGTHVAASSEENYETSETCGVCDGDYSRPHKPGCALDVALTAAGYPDAASRDAARKQRDAARKEYP